MSRPIAIALYDAPAKTRAKATEVKEVTWDELCSLLSVCKPTPCGAGCVGSDCPEKNGAGWSPLRFREGYAPVRAKQNVQAVTCAAFDVDEWTAQDWAPKLEDLERALKGEDFCLHSTHASIPALPKFRLVMPMARDVGQEEWARLWPVLVAKYKIPTKAGSLAAAARMYYLPSSGSPENFIFARE